MHKGALATVTTYTTFITGLCVLITPLAAGGIMMLIGKLRERRGQDLVGLDRFGYAVAFAFAMALVRYTFARGAL